MEECVSTQEKGASSAPETLSFLTIPTRLLR